MALALLLAACRAGGGDDFKLDGSPRHPDDEGIVTAVDHESLTLDGERTYELDRDLVSFSSIDLSTVPVLFAKDQYAQVGLDGDTAEWLGTVAKPLTTSPRRVVVVGEVASADDGTLVLEHGLVLRLAAGVDATVGTDVQISIDPDRGVVTEVEG